MSAAKTAALAAGLVALALPASAAQRARDSALNVPYVTTNLTTGQNGGFGFQAWEIGTSVNPSGAVGSFTATTTGNTDLNFIQTSTTPTSTGFAWGLFANDGVPVGEVPGLRIAAARRLFTGNPLFAGQTIKVALEHGNIRSGNFNPSNGQRDGGWVGITLRPSQFSQQSWEDPIETFGQIKGVFGFGFVGGQQNYSVYDSTTPSGRGTNVPFTRDGLRLEFTMTGPGAYELKVFAANGGALLDTITGTFSGDIGGIVLHNRNAELNDTFFNSLEVTTPCVADVDDGTNTGTLDGGVGIEDLLYYLALFEAGSLAADVDDGNGGGVTDGGVGIEDLLYFLQRFEAGC